MTHPKTIMEYFDDGTEDGGNVDDLVTLPPDGEEFSQRIKEKLHEFAEDGVEVTVTFKPELHWRYNPVTLTNIVREFFCTKRRRGYPFRLLLVGEFSKVGLYHMHGVLVTSPRTLHTIRYGIGRIGRTEFRYIRYPETWVEYVLKLSDDDRKHQKVLRNTEIVYFN